MGELVISAVLGAALVVVILELVIWAFWEDDGG